MAGTIARHIAVLMGSAGMVMALLGQTMAQESADAVLDTESTIILDRITIVSRTNETPIETMGSVSQVDQEQLERRMASTPLETLFGVPGVAVQADAKRSTNTINIRGLQDAGRVAVLVDGARQNFQRSGHGTESMFWIDPELIEQVDIIRGPISNTYGSGAIGGVVYFETKDAEDVLRDGESWALLQTLGYETNGSGWTTSTTGAAKLSESADILANIVWRDYGDYREGGGEVVEGTGFEALSGMVKASLEPTEFSRLRLGWIGSGDEWNEGAKAYAAELDQNTFTARYEITDPDASWLDLHINASVNKADHRRTFLVDANQYHPVTGVPITIPAGAQTSYDLTTYGIDAWNTSRFSTGAVEHELTYGGDWLSDDVETLSAAGGADDPYTPSGLRTVWGAYIQDKLTYDWLEVVGALRYDSYSLDDDSAESSGDRLSPRLTVGVSPFEGPALGGLQIYGTYAEGYRSPTVTETLTSGLHPSGVVFPFLPNPDLLPETARTWEAGINYSRDDLVVAGDSLRLKAAYFDNDVQDYIGTRVLSPFVPGSGCTFTPGPGRIPICYQYDNFAQARIRGFELEGIYDTGRYFAGLTVSIIDGHTIDEDGVRDELVTIPPSQVTGQLGARFLDGALTVGGEVQYNAAPDGAVYAEDFTLVNLFASYQAMEDFRLDMRVNNLFDVKYANPLNATTIAPVYEPGLNIKLAATMRLGG